ncbi:MAG: Obg family GTPase CgtA [Candidatus Daviesbacteria bacterium]|nr:Obg family GTPase CgtA [Candidatus Daviesbacteria bacterium]
MLIDEADIILKGGHGGAGKVSFGPSEKAGPDGGNGGKGGDLYLKVTSDLFALNQFSKATTLNAGDGENGGKNLKFGKNGKDLEIYLPLGTSLLDKDSEEELELSDLNQVILIAKGGLGGRGNAEFKSPRNTTPRFAQKGLPGQEKNLKVLLKLIADFGFIGLPNAGKSSLLNELTSAQAKVANYPFTTLEPNLGVLNSRVLADIPGLIEGASEGKGLGIKFLKHIEKVKLLLHCIDGTSEDVIKDYEIVRNELGNFSTKGGPSSGGNPELLQKEEIILLTKSDLIEKKDLEKKLKDLKKLKKEVLPISIHDYDSLEVLKKSLQ